MGRLSTTECTYPTYLPAQNTPALLCLWTRQHILWAPVAFLRLVCLTGAKEKFIDVKLSNILNFPHHVKFSRNEQWIKQNAIFWRRHDTCIIK